MRDWPDDCAGRPRLPTASPRTPTSSLPGVGLAALPSDAPLTTLGLGDGAIAGSGLRGLNHWTTLDYLNLREDVGHLDTQDWAEVGRLPHLTRLGIDAELIPTLAGAPQLPTVETVYVTKASHSGDLAPLARACPQLREVRLHPEKSSLSMSADPYTALFPDAEVMVQVPRPSVL